MNISSNSAEITAYSKEGCTACVTDIGIEIRISDQSSNFGLDSVAFALILLVNE